MMRVIDPLGPEWHAIRKWAQERLDEYGAELEDVMNARKHDIGVVRGRIAMLRDLLDLERDDTPIPVTANTYALKK